MNAKVRAGERGGIGGALAGIGLELAPYLAAIAAFALGALMVASAATPAIADRLTTLTRYAPILVVDFSHFAASLVGLLLMLVGSGLWARRQGAFWAALMLLIAGAVFSLIKGLEYEAAIVMLLVAALFWLQRRAFDRPSRIFSGRVSAAWLLATAGAVASAVVLSFWSYNNDIFTDEMLWTFVRDSDASRSYRAGVVVAMVVLVIALWMLFSTPAPRLSRPTGAVLDKVREILDTTPGVRADARIWLSGDKDFLFSDSGQSVLAYRIRRRHWIALGDPVGPIEERAELMWRFVEAADKAGGRAIFYGISADLLPMLAGMGFIMRLVGEDAVVDLSGFSLTGKARQNLRTACNKARGEGCEFEVLPRGSASGLAVQLRQLSNAWMKQHASGEKGFSMGFFDPAYLDRDLLAVVRRGREILAFSNVQTTADGREAGIDLMRYGPGAPAGVMDYLLVSLVEWAREQGCREFNLGMAPLSGLENRRLAPLFARVGALVFAEGGALYGFQGLHAFKAKFGPEWRPVYMAGRPGASLTLALLDVALLTGGGWRKVFLKG